MIISHKYKFIFIKTTKTAGTSIEVFLSQFCGDDDILTPFNVPEEGHSPRNFSGLWNPIPEMLLNRGLKRLSVLRRLTKRRKFYNHMPAKIVRGLVPPATWDGYFKFCVERNPWDKTLSHYHMIKSRKGGELSFESYLRHGRFPLNHPIYTDNDGRVIVDQVIKYESLTTELGELFARLGIPFNGSLGAQAKSGFRKDRTPYQQVYTEDQRRVIERAFAREIELHGYRFWPGEEAPPRQAYARSTGSISTASETSSGNASAWMIFASSRLSALIRCVRSMM